MLLVWVLLTLKVIFVRKEARKKRKQGIGEENRKNIMKEIVMEKKEKKEKCGWKEKEKDGKNHRK